MKEITHQNLRYVSSGSQGMSSSISEHLYKGPSAPLQKLPPICWIPPMRIEIIDLYNISIEKEIRDFGDPLPSPIQNSY